MDSSLFLDINRFQVNSSWAHGFFLDYATVIGLVLVAICAAIGVIRARREAALVGTKELAVGLWAIVGAAIGLGIAELIAHFVDRPRPFRALPHVAVLGSIPKGSGMPSLELAVAGALIAGLWLARHYVLASLASLCGLLLAYARIYIGVNYPSDVLAGLGLGGFVVLALSPLAYPSLMRWIAAISPTKLGFLVGAHHPTRHSSAGPASSPDPLAPSGSVRILSDPSVTLRAREGVHDPNKSVPSS